MAPEHSGFLLEYPLVRVDNFTGSLPPLPRHIDAKAREDLPCGSTHFVHPHLLLLSHPHTDHLNGLSSYSRHSAPIYCSDVTKQLLLALERKVDRRRYDEGKCSTRKRPYRHLQRSVRECAERDRQTGTHASTALDVLVSLPFDTPTYVPYTSHIKIRLTLLRANHMPGSTMFLLEGPRGAILHTGDVRCETNFVQSLLVHTQLSRIVVPYSPSLSLSPCTPPTISESRFVGDANAPIIIRSSASSESVGSHNEDRQTPSRLVSPLIALYLDTERILDNDEPTSRTTAIKDVIQLMRLLPTRTRFHVNCWTSGYEHFLLSIARAFDASKIHVDRYKAELYAIMALDEEFVSLPYICSTDKKACGRFCACDQDDCMQGAVTIEPRESLGQAEWTKLRRSLLREIKQARKGDAEYPSVIPLPMQRHSPLPELYRMIALLRPRHVVANTASLGAQFVLAKISEQLRLEGASEADQRQRVHLSKPSERDDECWAKYQAAWQETARVEETTNDQTPARTFYRKVLRFRQLLWGQRKLESERVLIERLDAMCDISVQEAQLLPSASISLLRPLHPNNAAVAPVTPKKPWSATGKYASTGSSPFMTAAMRETTNVGATSKAWPAPSGSPSNGERAIVTVGEHGSKARLSTELASRYIAYAAMYLGWKIRNPSRYRQDVVWRGIRKVKPTLARETEEALQRELGWAIPAWDERSIGVATASAAPVDVSDTPINASTPFKATDLQHAATSVSPLSLSRAALAHQLDEEAASQSMQFACDSSVHGTPEVNEPNSNDGQAALSCASLVSAASSTLSLEQLLEAMQNVRASTKPMQEACGLAVFRGIVEEWEAATVDRQRLVGTCATRNNRRAPRFLFKTQRMQVQLNLVGVAAHSRRGRTLMDWNGADFVGAAQTLKKLCEQHYVGKDCHAVHGVPARARVVLRYLKKAAKESI